MNIAILGGSFDPPHQGHQATAKRLLKLFNFGEVWLMPCYQHPFSKNLSPSDNRLEMTKYLESNSIKVSDFEVTKKSTSYSIDTLKYMEKTRPKDKFFWVIGTDQVKDFTKWKDWKEIINKFRLVVVPRTNFKKAEKELKNIAKLVAFPKHIILVGKNKFPPIYVSSTLIRKKIKEKKSISNMMPKKVEEYIIRHGLYLQQR